MGFKRFLTMKSLPKKINSIALVAAMVVGLLGGYVSVPTKNTTEVKAATSATAAASTQAPYRNVMYYGEWSIYSGQKNFYPSKIDGSLITHLNFAFLDMDANGDLVLCDEHADFLAVLPEQSGLTYGDPYAGVCGALSILRSKYPNMKIGISVGGWTRSGDFSAVAADPTKRQNFAKNIAKFVDYLGYDFVDIDWEYPTAVRESDPAGNGVTIDEGCPGSPADTQNFTYLLQSIRDELDKLGRQNSKYYELSVAMSASPAMMAKIEYDKVLDIVDFANMMTYDLNGAWAGFTAHQTALYTNDAYDKETQKDGQFSIDTCVKYLEQTYGNSIDYSKIVIGVAPYTRGWAGVKDDGRDPDNPGLYATAEPNSVKAADGTTSGTFAYGDIEQLKNTYKLKEYYDEKAQAAYYYSKETGYFFTCDNERSVAAKGEYVRNKKLGGLISWMASLDSANSITKVMHDSLYGDTALPAQEIKTANPNVSATITASGKQYTITLKNNETASESNTALKDAEMFKKTITYPKLYIKSKSGATFSAGSEAGQVSNSGGYGVIDLASVYAGKSIKPGASHTFTVNVSGNADLSDIESITMTRRILTTLSEFGSQVVYGNSSETPVTPTEAVTTKDEQTTTKSEQVTTKSEQTTTKATETPGEQQTTEAPTKVAGTGSYDPWTNGKEYNVGDLISYEGKVYECIMKHVANGSWRPTDPGVLGILWKERTDLVNIPTTADETSKGADTPEERPANTSLPAHTMTGYWHNFVNAAGAMKLGDVPDFYDIVCVSFTGNTTTKGEVTFSLDSDLTKALNGYSDADFKNDIKKLRARGQHVIISVGGAEGRIEIDSTQAANKFADGLIDIIAEYGFEGVDIDLEGSAVTGVDYIASALRKVYNHFNDKNFIITMAPETYYIQAGRMSFNDITTSYLRLAISIKDILTICQPQFYNTGGMDGYGGISVSTGSADFLTAMSTLVIEAGLRPDQVAIGVPSTPSAASSGYVSADTVIQGFNCMINGTSSGKFTPPRAYSSFRGVMTWSINWDATKNYEWGRKIANAVHSLNTEQPTQEITTEPETTEPETTKPETTTEPETTKPETTTEPEQTGIVVSDGVKVNGYQISATVKGTRTVYSVENKINGKQVVNVGLVYSLDGYAQADEMYVGSDNKYVKSFEATEKGKLSANYSGSQTATSYAMTMKFAVGSESEYTAKWVVRAYAKLSDGTYVYSDMNNYTIFDIAKRVYDGCKMNTAEGHKYLYTDILKVVDKDYKEVDYDWNNEIVSPY